MLLVKRATQYCSWQLRWSRRMTTTLKCTGCGRVEDGAKTVLFKCPNHIDAPEIDHVLSPVSPGKDATESLCSGADIDVGETNPFLRYRSLLYSYRVALSRGMQDEDYVQLVTDLNKELTNVGAGTAFAETPLLWNAELNAFVKNETLNVAQSHKARHLFNVMIYLLVMSQGDDVANLRGRRLAVASCGNAGLAAATVAAAANWPIDVCIPPDAEPAVVEELNHLGASVHICRRDEDSIETPLGTISTTGEADPTLAAFKNFVKHHQSIPFSVQGSECGLGVEGSQTIAWEVLEAIGRDYSSMAAVHNHGLGNLFIQVGGGALGAGLVQGFQRALEGELSSVVPQSLHVNVLPKIFTVQPVGNAPLHRAFSLMKQDNVMDAEVAAQTRARYMFPWENPHSIAHGILDDETYDWVPLISGMLKTNGEALLVEDEPICAAKSFAEDTFGLNPCHTGSAGLAGMMEYKAATGDENINLVILSGLDRRSPRPVS